MTLLALALVFGVAVLVSVYMAYQSYQKVGGDGDGGGGDAAIRTNVASRLVTITDTSTGHAAPTQVPVRAAGDQVASGTYYGEWHGGLFNIGWLTIAMNVQPTIPQATTGTADLRIHGTGLTPPLVCTVNYVLNDDNTIDISNSCADTIESKVSKIKLSYNPSTNAVSFSGTAMGYNLSASLTPQK